MNGTMSKQVKRLRDSYRERYSEELFRYRERVFTETLREMEGQPRILALACALRRYLETKQVFMSGDDILAGHGQFVDWKHSGPAEFYEEIDRLEEREDRTDRQRFVLRQMRAGMQMGLYSRYPGGHLIPNYGRILRRGYDETLRLTEALFREASPESRDFYGACLHTLKGAQKNILRYAEKAKELLSDCQEPEGQARLRRMEESCRHIAHHPPRGFFDAVQLLWLTHEAVVSEQVCGSLSFGRADRYLYPYYERDREEGRLTREEAADILQAFWLKCAGLPVGYQNLTLGGTDPEGRDQSNELTLLCLEAARTVKVDQPLLSLRIDPATPDAVWEEAQRVIGSGVGFPALFNDRAVIPTREAMGASFEEACDYAVVGCVEQSVPGREYAHTEGMRHNWPKVLELMLGGGRCSLTGDSFPLENPRNPEEIGSFEEFTNWYADELRYTQQIALEYMQMADEQYGQLWPTPFASVLMDGCLQSGRDVTQGGTRYNHSTINATGMANAVDSLSAIREAVYRRKFTGFPQLIKALGRNFEGDELLLGRLRGQPKFGNGLEETDSLLTRLANRMIDGLEGLTNPRGGKYQMGFYSVGNHAIMGKKTGATPEGRLRGTALANSLSPVQGMDTNGPTAVLLSALHAPMGRLHNGMALDLKFSPGFFKIPRHKAAVRRLTEAFFEQGGQELQFNVVDGATLLEAQAHPSLYRDLLVRVSGFSAFFVTLDETLQNEIIARSEFSRI